MRYAGIIIGWFLSLPVFVFQFFSYLIILTSKSLVQFMKKHSEFLDNLFYKSDREE